jgi:hypothetical protein
MNDTKKDYETVTAYFREEPDERGCYTRIYSARGNKGAPYTAQVIADVGKDVTLEAEGREIEDLDEAKRWAEATMTKLRALLEEEPLTKPWEPDEEISMEDGS